MKTLFLLRHGKSSRDDPELDDHDRPLKPRGRRAAQHIGDWLQQSSLSIDRVLCSTAVRARETWELAASRLRRVPPVEYTEALYLCPVAQFAQVLRSLPASVQSVLLVGHNPGLEDLLACLTGERQPLPTGTLVQLECPIDSWAEWELDLPCTLKACIRPRELEDD